MDTGKIVFIIIMGWTLIIHGGLTYLLVKKKEYSLISGFYNRPDDEKAYLKENGYTAALGKVLTVTFYLFVLAFLLALLPIPYGFEIGIAVFLVVLLVGVVWAQRFKVPHKRKKMLWGSGSVSGLTVVGNWTDGK